MLKIKCLLVALILFATATVADANCALIGAPTVTLSTALVNLGTNTVPVPVSLTVTATYPKTGSGACTSTDLVAFNALLALTRVGGTQTLTYTVTPNGGAPTFPSASVSNGQVTVSATLTVTVALVAGQTGTSGTYVGTLTARMVTSGGTTTGTSASAALQATVNNPATCTIGGSANGGTQTLDFSNGNTVSLSQKFATFGTVNCNSSAVLSLTSQNGAATNPAATDASHQNYFDYIATTTVNGGTVTLNTSTNPARSAPESGTGNITATTTTNAALSIGVTPIAPTKPLVAGSYGDVLTLTITPN